MHHFEGLGSVIDVNAVVFYPIDIFLNFFILDGIKKLQSLEVIAVIKMYFADPKIHFIHFVPFGMSGFNWFKEFFATDFKPLMVCRQRIIKGSIFRKVIFRVIGNQWFKSLHGKIIFAVAEQSLTIKILFIIINLRKS